MAFDSRKRIMRGVIGLFLAIIAAYALYQTRDLIFGARLQVTSLTDGTVATEQLLTIEGRMKHAAAITINSNEIKTNQEGYFSEKILLSPGYNVITISARDRFGKSIEKTYRVLYNEQANEPEILE